MNSSPFPASIFEWAATSAISIGIVVIAALFNAVGHEAKERQKAVNEATRAGLAEAKELWIAFDTLRSSFEAHRGKMLETMATRADMDGLNMRLLRMEERLTQAITGAVLLAGRAARNEGDRGDGR